jgi:ribonucleotide reductase alpha subunit
MAPACWARSTSRGWWRSRSPTARTLDETALADLVATAIRMMDNVVDASRFPLEAQARRRMPSGASGWA